MAVSENAPPTYDLPTYELLLHAMVETRLGLEKRWFLAGGHHSRDLAREAFQGLCAEFPAKQVVLLLVASVLDPATQRFRDVIIESRGIAPLIDRKRLGRLTHHARTLIATATEPRLPPVSRPLPAPPRRRFGVWLTLGGVALAAVAILVLLPG